MLFNSVSLISLLAVVPVAVQAVPVFSHSDWLLPRQAAGLQAQLSLDPSQVATGSQQDGQGADVADNQVRSKTSDNNFVNFCLTQNVPLTDGQQIKTGSCNPTIMGVIASTNNMPRSRFTFPKNGEVVKANVPFTLQMKIGNLQTGNFVNPQTNYYAAPQVVNGGGDIIGHSHVTIQKMDDVTSPKPLDPSVFAFFKGFNNQAKDGILTADVPAPGLPEGFYRMCSINTAANHQPVLVAVAQHGSLDDCVYFKCEAEASNEPFFNNLGGKTAGAGGAGNGNGNNNNNGKGDKAATGTTAAPPAATSAAAGNNGGAQGGQGGANNGNAGGAQGGQSGGAQGGQGGANNGNAGGAQGGQNGGAQGNKGGNNNQGNNNQGQAAQQAADKAKQEADAKKAAEDKKKAEEAAKAAGGANAKQQAAQQAADKAKQAADAKKAAEDQKKAQQQSNNNNNGGRRNRRSLRFQRD